LWSRTWPPRAEPPWQHSVREGGTRRAVRQHPRRCHRHGASEGNRYRTFIEDSWEEAQSGFSGRREVYGEPRQTASRNSLKAGRALVSAAAGHQIEAAGEFLERLIEFKAGLSDHLLGVLLLHSDFGSEFFRRISGRCSPLLFKSRR